MNVYHYDVNHKGAKNCNALHGKRKQRIFVRLVMLLHKRICICFVNSTYSTFLDLCSFVVKPETKKAIQKNRLYNVLLKSQV